MFHVVQNMYLLTKLHRFNDFVKGLGCAALMERPYIVDRVGFVGSIAWYDYSFAPEWLGLSLEDLELRPSDSIHGLMETILSFLSSMRSSR